MSTRSPLLRTLGWVAVSLAGAGALGEIALSRGETISAAWIVVAGLCSYAVAYRFYSRFIASKIFELDDRRPTPAERLENGRDFVPTTWPAMTPRRGLVRGSSVNPPGSVPALPSIRRIPTREPVRTVSPERGQVPNRPVRAVRLP